MSFLRYIQHFCSESLFEFLGVAAVLLNGHSPEPVDATRTALGSDSMQVDRHT